MTHRTRIVGAVAAAAALLVAASAGAQTGAPTPPAETKPADPYTLSANVGIFSQYVFRGLTQTDAKPAIQGGFDYAHQSGFYLGTWGSNISWLEDSGACHGCSLEWDMYGGWKHAFNDDWGMDAGLLYYYYPGSYNPGTTKANTTELYVAGNWKWVSLKFSDSVTNTFGVPDSHNAWYLDLTGNYPIDERWTILTHVGRQEYPGSTNGVSNSQLNYTDWRLGASYTINNYTFGAYWTDTDNRASAYTINGRNIGRSTGTVYIQRTF